MKYHRDRQPRCELWNLQRGICVFNKATKITHNSETQNWKKYIQFTVNSGNSYEELFQTMSKPGVTLLSFDRPIPYRTKKIRINTRRTYYGWMFIAKGLYSLYLIFIKARGLTDSAVYRYQPETCYAYTGIASVKNTKSDTG